EVWRAAMELLKSYFRQTVDMLRETASLTGLARIYFKDFGELEFEKYLGLRSRSSVKRTWFFRVDFRSGDASARYLFFFGFPSPRIRSQSSDVAVTLHIARETDPFV